MKMKIGIIVAIILFQLIAIAYLWINYFQSFIIGLTGFYVRGFSINANTTPEHLPDFIIRSNDSILGDELRPNFTQIFDGYYVRLYNLSQVTINSDGFRGRDYSLQKPNNTFRIVVLGDSVAFGWGVNDNETFSYVLERTLNGNAGKKYEVLNLAVPGYSTVEEAEMLKTKGVKYDPNLIVIYYHFNDIENITKHGELTAKYLQELQNTTLSDYEKNIVADENASEALLNDTLMSYERSNWKNTYPQWDEIYDLTNNGKIPVLIVTGLMRTDSVAVQRMQKVADFLSEKIMEGKTNWYFFSMQHIIMQYPPEELVVHPADGHPNPFAHKLIADKIYKFLKQNSIVQ